MKIRQEQYKQQKFKHLEKEVLGKAGMNLSRQLQPCDKKDLIPVVLRYNKRGTKCLGTKEHKVVCQISVNDKKDQNLNHTEIGKFFPAMRNIKENERIDRQNDNPFDDCEGHIQFTC